MAEGPGSAPGAAADPSPPCHRAALALCVSEAQRSPRPGAVWGKTLSFRGSGTGRRLRLAAWSGAVHP